MYIHIYIGHMYIQIYLSIHILTRHEYSYIHVLVYLYIYLPNDRNSKQVDYLMGTCIHMYVCSVLQCFAVRSGGKEGQKRVIGGGEGRRGREAEKM